MYRLKSLKEKTLVVLERFRQKGLENLCLTLTSLKFLLGFGKQRFSFSLVCSFLPITTM